MSGLWYFPNFIRPERSYLLSKQKNQNKIKEIKPLFPKKYKILSLDEIGFKGEILENGNTLEENAKIKADLISKKYSIDCFADDSGLEIEAL